MKVDKEVLIKHHFWILAGVSVIPSLVAILVLITAVSGAISKTKQELVQLQKSLPGDVPTREMIKTKKVEAESLEKEETTAWGKAYKEQEALFTWPRKFEDTYHYANGLFSNTISVLKTPEKEQAWPEDKPGELVHGTLDWATDIGFGITGKDGKAKYTFLATPKQIDRGLESEDGGNKTKLNFKDLQHQKGKLLAVGYQKGKYFNDRMTVDEMMAYKKTYLTQIPPILKIVDPVHVEDDKDGKPIAVGVVQLKSSGWMFRPEDAKDYSYTDEIPDKVRDGIIPPPDSKFLRFVPVDWNITKDISDEAWIAQEDLWVQTEIYRLIRAANDSISLFTETAKDKDNKGATYRNPYFEMALRLKDDRTLEVKVSNLLNRRQKIDVMRLRVKLDVKGEPEVVTITGDPLEPRGTSKLDSRVITLPLDAGPVRTGVFGLEQVLTWETAAVKRIDQISIGSASSEMSLSHRTLPVGVQPFIKVDKKEGEDSKVTMKAPSGSGDLQQKYAGGTGQGAPGGGGLLGGFGAAGQGAGALANGLSPERYQEVTSQFRRIPIAISLIVDQNHVDRVQTAFNNSKLRFLTTQVLLNHYPVSLRPQVPGDKAGGSNTGEARPGNYSFMPPSFGKSGSGMPGRFGTGAGFGPSGISPPGVGAQTGPSDDLEANLELVIYGVVTLYERYPPRPASAEVPGQAVAEKK
jgi:hypothetical protein